MANKGPGMNASAFFITTATEIPEMHKRHRVFAYVAEGKEVLEKINKAYCDT